MKHQSFIYALLNDLRVLFYTIQFSLSHLFVRSLNVKQFYLTYQVLLVRAGVDLEQWQWRILRMPQSSNITWA